MLDVSLLPMTLLDESAWQSVPKPFNTSDVDQLLDVEIAFDRSQHRIGKLDFRSEPRKVLLDGQKRFLLVLDVCHENKQCLVV